MSRSGQRAKRGQGIRPLSAAVQRPAWRAAIAWLACLTQVTPCVGDLQPQPRPLSPAAARALAADAEALVIDLSHLAAIEPEAARSLSRFSGVLDLSGLTELEPEVAEALAPCGGLVVLSGVTALEPEAATALARCPGAVDLSGLRSLSRAVIRSLSAYRGRQLELSCFVVAEGIDQASAAELEAIPALAVKSPDAVARQCRQLSAADVPLLRMLARRRECQGVFSVLTALDAEAATALADFTSPVLSLDRLRTLDLATARVLAGFKGRLRLPELSKISPKTLAALLEKGDVDIPLIETLELIPEPDGSATEDFVIPEGLPERQKQQAR